MHSTCVSAFFIDNVRGETDTCCDFCCLKVNMRIWKFVTVATGCGVTVGVVLLVSAALWNKTKTGENFV